MPTNTQPDSIAEPAHLMVEEVWSRGDLPLIDDITTEDYVQHDSGLPEPIRGRDALKETIATYRAGTPDLTKTVDRTFVDGNNVIIPYTATGTHDGEIMGIPSTGRPVEVDGVFVFEVEDGRLAQGRDLWDAFGLLGQIGALPEPLGG